MNETIVLGSENPFVGALLKNAGITVEMMADDLDERAMAAPLEDTGASPEDIAHIWAEAKATDVSGRRPGVLVLGCEQTLSLNNEILYAPADTDEAVRRLLLLSGKTHQVSSAAVLARDGVVVWRNVDVAYLTMCKLDPGFIGRYLSRVGAEALQHAGVYRIDGEGIQLFEKIQGDYFTIAGIPLLPLLAELRRIQAIDC